MDLDILTRLTRNNHVFPVAADAALAGLHVNSVGTRCIEPPNGQDLDRSAQDQHGLTYVVQGEATFLKPQPARPVRERDVLILPAGSPYCYRSSEGRGWKAVWIRFTAPPRTLEQLGLKIGPMCVGSEVRRAVADVLALASAHGSFGPRLAASVSRLLAELASSVKPLRPSDMAIDAALSDIRGNPRRSWQMPELARRHGLSYSALRQGLRRRTGMAPSRLLRQERLHLVAQALVEGHSVTMASALGGFSDPFHCSRLFRQTYGFSPRQWLRQLQI
jgi:AraC-like DNA-binding protein